MASDIGKCSSSTHMVRPCLHTEAGLRFPMLYEGIEILPDKNASRPEGFQFPSRAHKKLQGKTSPERHGYISGNPSSTTHVAAMTPPALLSSPPSLVVYSSSAAQAAEIVLRQAPSSSASSSSFSQPRLKQEGGLFEEEVSYFHSYLVLPD